MKDERIELSKFRLEKSKEDLDNAVHNIKQNFLKGSINRSYYAIFHAIRAVLLLIFLIKKNIPV